MLDPAIEEIISRALKEDVGLRDVTTEAVVERGRKAMGRIEQREPGMVYGYEVAAAVFSRLDPASAWRSVEPEGSWRKDVPAVVAEVAGDARALLTAERVALNFLQRLSGIATVTAGCVYALRDTGVQVLDTRKTTPGLRLLEKRAVAAGGGHNHRQGLYDAILVKDNHIRLAGGVGEATRRALGARPGGLPVEVECRTLEDVEEGLAAGAERLLLDNMTTQELRRAVELNRGRASLEASGGITPGAVREVAATGVQFISLGALTHSAPALDLSMKLEAV